MNESSSMELPINLTPAEMELLNEVDKQIESSLISGDVRSVLKFGRSLRRGIQINGVAFAKLLAKIEDHWQEYRAGGVDDEFVDVMYAELGSSPSTVRKYVGMWRAIFENNTIPQSIKDALLGRPIKSLLLLTAAANEGSLDWNKMLETSTHAEVQQIIRETRGEATSSKTRITIKLYRSGELVAINQNQIVNIGSLIRDPNDPIATKAIDRIVSSAGILED